MCATSGLSNSAYALIAPFLPFEFKEKGVPQVMVGWIFIMYSIAVIIGSPLIGRMLSKFGRIAFL